MLGAKMADFGGWAMPIEYAGTGVLAEHRAVRTAVGLFDVSHMGTAIVRGPGAVAALNAVLTNDLNRIGAGQAQYTLLCDESGGVIDDMLVYRRSDDEVMIVPNAANSDRVVATLRDALQPEVEVWDRRAELGILAVQGPAATAVLDARGLPTSYDYMTFRDAAVDDQLLSVCRSGYTGARGFEIIAPVGLLVALWDDLLTLGRPYGMTPAGLGARDTLRTEMGYPLHGQDLGPSISPVQARLGWAVGWTKASFAGREALTAEKARGPHRVLRGLLARDRSIPRPHMSVHDESGTDLGEVTSGTFSPTLRSGIALALLPPDLAVGSTVRLDVRGRSARYEVVNPPFVVGGVR